MTTTKIPQPDQNDLSTYLQAVSNRHGKQNLASFQERNEREVAAVHLDRIYVPLRLGGQAPHMEKASAHGAAKESAVDELRSNQLLAPVHQLGRHLVILGDAGSGKTTILRHLAVSLADAWLQQDMALARSQTGFTGETTDLLWPIFVPLRHFDHFCHRHDLGHTWGHFMDFLPDHFAQLYNLNLPAAFYQALLENGRCLLALDGFDELPDVNARHQIIDIIRGLATAVRTRNNHILLSSRVAAYGGPAHLGGEFQTLWVQNLNLEERETQVKRWVAEIAPNTERILRADDILDRMPPDSPLDSLAITPMIVTAICIVYFYDHELPEQRALLYRRCIDIMLDEGLRRDAAGRALAKRSGSLAVKRKRLAQLAFAMHYAGKDNISRQQAMAWLAPSFRRIQDEDQRTIAIETFLESVVDRGTLLQEKRGRFGFGPQHLTFREYLASQHLIQTITPAERADIWPELLPSDRWREPIRLAVGATATEATQISELFLAEMVEQSAGSDDPDIRLAGYRLAAEALWDAGHVAREEFLDPDLQAQIIAGLALRLLEPAVASPDTRLLPQRVLAADVLGRLGDTREGVITLPPLLTAPLSGEFQFGESNQPRTLPPFQAGIYPVTNAQFALFMEVKGYQNEHWWSAGGLKWLQNPPNYRQRPLRAPEYWNRADLNNPNQPVVGVSWYEAEAFCAWLSTEFGRLYRLPTEEEWERLARGQHGRIYPWGNDWQAGLCNTEEIAIGTPSAVGLFPGGISPTGTHDCAGNVWEWYSVPGKLKGGSWVNNKEYARSWARGSYDPYHGDFSNGFRVVAPIS